MLEELEAEIIAQTTALIGIEQQQQGKLIA